MLVPVTPTWNVTDDAKLHERVEVPEPVTPVGDRLHQVLFVVRATNPVKPFRPVTVIVDVPAEPALIATLVGLAAMLKSGISIVTDMVAECELVVFELVTVTV